MLENTRDVVCLIHGSKYPWEYVEKLYSMATRHSSVPVRFHVLTEKTRLVPPHMIKHELIDWPDAAGPNLAWWYKMQLFDLGRFSMPMLYLDLDVVIVGNLDWIWQLDTRYFWTIRDFQYLYRGNTQTINSSIMSWDPAKYYWIWEDFDRLDRTAIIRKYKGDQNYLSAVLPPSHLRLIDADLVKSWRWQIAGGGWDFDKRRAKTPNITPTLDASTKIIVFHGDPKPQDIKDNIVKINWI
jgi:hypothetical protein